jgi:CDP-diacylglycerol--glycerol-3-phosphate 3-phosphatidyltransferase
MRGVVVPLSLANKITLLRLFCIPFFVLMLIYYDRSVLAGARNEYFRISAALVFLLIFLSDAIDGYIARTRNQITRLGTILDPLADKALLLSALILLSFSHHGSYQAILPVWFVWLVICRDIMLVAGGVLIHFITGTVTVRPRISGKITTFLQMTIIVWVMANLPAAAFRYILWAGAGCTVISGVQYFLDGIRQFDRS